MHDRITHRLVTFLHPFSLAGVEDERPAGTYEIETTEAPINGLSILGYLCRSSSRMQAKLGL